MIKTLALWILITLTAAAAQRASETPIGNIDGSNIAFHLSALPYTDSLKLYKNGLRLAVNADYTLNSQSVSLAVAPTPGDYLVADYDILAPAGYHALISKATGSCLTPSGTNKIVSVACAGSDSQKLSTSLSTFGYILTVKTSNQAYDLFNSAIADGTPIIQAALSGSKGQQWKLVVVDNDQFFELTNSLPNGNSCLTLLSGSISLQTCNGLDSQKWQWQ